MNDFLFSIRPIHVSDYMGNDFFDSSDDSRREFEPAGTGRSFTTTSSPSNFILHAPYYRLRY